MAVEITVGPPVLTINRDDTFMVTDHNGEVNSERSQGVFSGDTRFVSSYHLRIDGKPWHRLSSTTTSYHSAQIFLINPTIASAGVGTQPATVPSGTINLSLARSVESGQLEEIFRIANHSMERVAILLEIEIGSDFADLFEVKTDDLRRRPNVVTTWNAEHAELVTTYRNKDFLRRFVYRVTRADQPPSYANGQFEFAITLDPGATWRAAGHMLLQTSEASREPRRGPPTVQTITEQSNELHQRWIDRCTGLDAADPDVGRAYRQSVDDFGALRLLERDLGPDCWIPAAGVPWYTAPFGRDSLIASIQSMPVNARFAEGALRMLAEHQAKERDDWRDAQPGKILHEIRHGELAHFHLIPHTPYYGTWDATPLYLITLREAWRWLGDRKLIESLRPTIGACLGWIDHFGDLDGDGFQEYKTFSSMGYENMAWKDSHDGVVHPDGTPVPQPKALCELQGYVYAAKLGAAELFRALGDADRARDLTEQAADLKRRFNEAFWMEDEGTFAFALDPEKRQVRTVTSNPGHCLWTGIVDADKAPRVIERLLAPDMWSGWGIRTLSAKHQAYNPSSYQRGSVWPHDNGIGAAGMKRYGNADAANQVARGILDAAAIFQSARLPEVFAGIGREESPFPVQYRGANIPQAWAAGSIFHLIRTILWLDADVPNGRLTVQPTLPDWLPWLELNGLKVGPVSLDIRFWRDGDESRFAVQRESGGHLRVEAKSASEPGSPDEQQDGR